MPIVTSGGLLAQESAEADKLLKPDQREKFEGVADVPATHMGMHKMMMEKMKAKMKK